MLVAYKKVDSKQEDYCNLDTYDHSDLQRIVREHANSISVMDNQGNVLMVFMGVSVANFVGANIKDMNKKGIYDWSPCLEAIKTRKGVLGTVGTRYGVEQIVSCTPILDDMGEVALVVDVALDKKIIDEYLTSINSKDKVDNIYKISVDYLSSGDAFTQAPVAESEVMRQIIETCDTVAKTDSSILLTGESGTGKEVLARYIHRKSLRCHKPFIPVNCAAIPPQLLEAEFFGYAKGAFTGANPKGKPGLFEMADKGTLFLDEIGDLPLEMQSKLLRVLESGEIKSVGGTKIKKTDVRIISATNKNLPDMVRKNSFRDDLYYRLSVVPINVPSLRDRQEDILPLANKFLNELNNKYGFNKTFTKETINAFYEYEWPGNVRELRNIIERLVVTSPGEELHFMINTPVSTKKPSERVTYMPDFNTTETLKSFMDRVEKEYIEKILAETNGRVSEAAKRLGIHRTMLYRKIKAKNISCYNL